MTTVVAADEMQRRLSAVPRPRPILGRQRESELTDRQRQILDGMEVLMAGGFADLTMAELAARLNCSLRTLYALAPSRDELVLIVIDRSLWRIGRVARDAVGEDLAPLDAIRVYLEAATVAVSGWTQAFAHDLASVRAAQQLQDDHNEYLFEVTRTLLDLATARGDIAPVDTTAVARVLAGLGQFFSRPSVIPTLRSSPKEAADEVVDLIIGGLRALPQEGAS